MDGVVYWLYRTFFLSDLIHLLGLKYHLDTKGNQLHVSSPKFSEFLVYPANVMLNIFTQKLLKSCFKAKLWFSHQKSQTSKI